MSPVNKKIRVSFEITEYEASLLLGLVRERANEARRAQRFIEEVMPSPVPNRLATWGEIAEKLKAGIAEGRIE